MGKMTARNRLHKHLIEFFKTDPVSAREQEKHADEVLETVDQIVEKIYGKRQMELALLVLDKGISLDKIAHQHKRSRNHIGNEILFGALLLREKNKMAARLSDLGRMPGIGCIKAIRQFLIERQGING